MKRILPKLGLLIAQMSVAEPAWDLRVGHAGHQWDVIMLINWGEKAETLSVNLTDLGLDPGGKYALFDFWQKVPVGTVANGRIELLVPATGSRVTRLTPLTDHPEVIGIARHITQGLVSLRSLTWEARGRVLAGESQVPSGDPDEFWVHVPEGYKLQSARSLPGEVGCAPASLEVLHCTIRVPTTGEVKWELNF